MGVMRGSKKTDVGLIPTDWNVVLLGEIATVSSGGTPSRRVDEFWGGEISWVTTAEIDFNEVNETTESITALGLKHSAAKLLQPGTLLMALYGQGKTRGKVAVLGVAATTNQACASIWVSGGVSRKFVFHYLASQYVAIRGLSNSGSQENLSGQIVRSLKIPLAPSKEEQEAIADALSDADSLIESLEQLLAKKRQIKQGAMQDLLTGKRRLPGFRTHWKTLVLGEVAILLKGSGLSRSAVSQSGVRACVLYGELFTVYGRVISRVSSRTDSVGGVESKMGDVLMPGSTTTSGVDLAIASAVLEDGVALGGDINIIRQRAGDFFDSVFLAYLLTYGCVSAISELAQGITIHHLYGRDLRKLSLRLPPIAEQLAIARVISDMDAELIALEERIAKARKLKQGMMQELLTGRIRLV